MNNLTAEKCREQFEEWFADHAGQTVEWVKSQRANDTHYKTGPEINGYWFAWQASRQALEIALPILEQQEQKQKVGVREGLAALSAHIDSIGGYNFEALEAYRREEFGQQARGESEWVAWVGGECPVAGHVKVEYQLRGGAKGSEPAKRLEWQHEGKRHDIIAYRIIPDRDTNQNGEQ